MPGSFDITPIANNVAIDSTSRKGDTSFTVTNASTRELKGRAKIAADNPKVLDWVTIGGNAERTFPVNGTQQYAVQIKVPLDAPEGNYAFRLNMVGVDNPDEDFAEGPSVAFAVTTKPVITPVVTVKRGYITTLVGMVIGGLVGGVIGAAPAGIFFLVNRSKPDNLGDTIGFILGWILLLIAGAGIGFWVGAVIGSWQALARRGFLDGGKTALVLAIILPVFLFVGGFFINASDTSAAFVRVLATLMAIIIGIIIPPLLARAAIYFHRTGHV